VATKSKKANTVRKIKRHSYAVKLAGKTVPVRHRRFMLAFTGERLMDGKPYEGHVINLKTGEPVSGATATKGKARFIGCEPAEAVAAAAN
jgi:hypothetical protein